MSDWFASSWATVGYVAASTAAIYSTTVLAVRVAGRRTVAQLSAFDVVVTIALGSLIASTAVSRDPSYAQGTTALVTLLVLQVGAGAARQRFPAARKVLDFAPFAVVCDGQVHLPTTPLGPQMTVDELFARLREQGVFGLDGIRLVVVEPTGGISVEREGEAPPDAAVALHGGGRS